MSAQSQTTYYGIRHHGPGCARSLVASLEQQRPDVILLESPAETEPLLVHAGNEQMKPPVSILVYQADEPQMAGFYPFARFSPEWQAIRWALEHEVPVRCFDLPSAHSFALRARAPDHALKDEDEDEDEKEKEKEKGDERLEAPSFAPDPFTHFARADGYSDGERWWNDTLEERQSSPDFFAAILEAVTALRTELDLPEDRSTLLREAWMRKILRKTEREGHESIAVVCGAWHTPALVQRPKVGEDNALLKGLPKVKVAATWTPWTLSRLTTASGYGAGIRSPGWYEHLWEQPKHPTISWLTRAARILRRQDLEGSSASIIEAVRLSESLAGLRGRPRPGLDESLEAIRTVFCSGDEAPLGLLEKPLLIGEALGSLPPDVSLPPLQQDIEAQQRRLRLKPTAAVKEVTLDLREDGGRRRSAFLHRLAALGIDWGEKTSARTKGTFKEVWRLAWAPSLVLEIVDASRYGNTLEAAATRKLSESTPNSTLQELSKDLDLALLSDLPTATRHLLTLIDHAAAAAQDTADLLGAIPNLVRIVRYGDVRDTDVEAVLTILLHLATRAHIELPGATAGLNEEAATRLGTLLRSYASALGTLDLESISCDFQQALRQVIKRPKAHASLCGIAVRLLRDANQLAPEEVSTHFSFALSSGRAPQNAANWLEGFLAGSGSILVHDTPLLALIDRWLATLADDIFTDVLPLLRRTFGAFTSPERQRIGMAVAQGMSSTPKTASESTINVDASRAQPAVETVRNLLNL